MTVKTAISVPDELFEQVDAMARTLGIPRSRLISNALAEYLERRSRSTITEELDRVYDDTSADQDNAVGAVSRRLLRETEW